MAQFAGGSFRLTVRHKNGDRITSSTPVDYTIYDNVATPRVIINAPNLATSQDQAEDFPEMIHGAQGEFLTVDVLHTAAITLATTSCVVRLLCEAYKKNPRTGGVSTDRGRLIAIGDRITKSTASTTNDPRGINDNKVSVANEWTAVLAFAPAGQGENVLLKGFQYILIDGA